MQSKFTRFFQLNLSALTKRSLWGDSGKPLKEYYPVQRKDKLIINSYSFESSTLRGQSLNDGQLDLASFLWNAFPKGFVYRGMDKEEFTDPINRKLCALVGRKQLVVHDEQGKVDATLTRANLNAHQEGTVHGISTSESLKTAFWFSKHIGQESAILLIDTHNVPEGQIYPQDYGNPDRYGYDQDGVPLVKKYSKEKEFTISSIDISDIFARVTRSGMTTIHLECNPFYVDQKLLTAHLREMYKEHKQLFHATTYGIRQQSNPDAVSLFLESRHELYNKLAQSSVIDPDRKERIDAVLNLEETSILENKPRK